MLRMSCCSILILRQVSNENSMLSRPCFGTIRGYQQRHAGCFRNISIRKTRRSTRIIRNNRVERLAVGRRAMLQ